MHKDSKLEDKVKALTPSDVRDLQKTIIDSINKIVLTSEEQDCLAAIESNQKTQIFLQNAQQLLDQVKKRHADQAYRYHISRSMGGTTFAFFCNFDASSSQKPLLPLHHNLLCILSTAGIIYAIYHICYYFRHRQENSTTVVIRQMTQLKDSLKQPPLRQMTKLKKEQKIPQKIPQGIRNKKKTKNNCLHLTSCRQWLATYLFSMGLSIQKAFKKAPDQSELDNIIPKILNKEEVAKKTPRGKKNRQTASKKTIPPVNPTLLNCSRKASIETFNHFEVLDTKTPSEKIIRQTDQQSTAHTQESENKTEPKDEIPEQQSPAALMAENQNIRRQLHTSQQHTQQLQQKYDILSKMLTTLLSVLHKIGLYPSWEYNDVRDTQYVIINSFWRQPTQPPPFPPEGLPPTLPMFNPYETR
jgi:hypothetical protein